MSSGALQILRHKTESIHDRQASFVKTWHDSVESGSKRANEYSFGVVDHRAKPGSDPGGSAMATHRIDPAIVIRDFLAAGFELEAQSDVLRNPEDDLERGVFDPTIRGHTDRFVLRFRR